MSVFFSILGRVFDHNLISKSGITFLDFGYPERKSSLLIAKSNCMSEKWLLIAGEMIHGS